MFVECCLSQFSSKQKLASSDCAGSDDDSIALAFRYLLFLSASQILFCFKQCGSFDDEATPLCVIQCSLLSGLSWNIEALNQGFKGVFVGFPLTTLRALSFLKFSIQNFLWQSLIRHSCNMASPSRDYWPGITTTMKNKTYCCEWSSKYLQQHGNKKHDLTRR